MRIHHLVLLMLAAPIVGVGIVLWFLLPGSVGGLTYTPSAFNREATLRPIYWSAHDATIEGYLRVVRCTKTGCPILVIEDRPVRPGSEQSAPNPERDIVLLAQGESGWHNALRRLLPRFIASPITTRDHARKVTVTARLLAGLRPGQLPTMEPNTL